MDVEQVSRSVVALRASVPDDAFTAPILGTLREGSGVVIRENGLILTIGYLATEAEEVWLTTHDKRVVPGHVLAIDQETGFGLVQALAPLDLPALPLGDSDAARVGAGAWLIDGSGEWVETKLVARQEFAGYWEYVLDDAIFTAPAHPSWGGAALVGNDGTLLGVGSLRLQMVHGRQVEDINMIVPIDIVKPILEDVLMRGQIDKQPRPWLGAFAAETNGRVVVMNVTENAPAAKAGLRQGDIIAEIRDKDVEGLADFYRKVWSTGPAGSEIPIRILRDGRDAWLRIKSADRESFLKKPKVQ